jgi:NAD(P)-dependent dehydrogenase (short-subunit alcohol dehydrogenase family)
MHEPPGPKLVWPGAEAVATMERPAARSRRYSYSKLCNLYFTYELARRLEREHSGVSAAAFNPGLMTDTNFAAMPAPVGAVLRRVFASRVGSLDTSSTALARLTAGLTDVPIDGNYFDRTAVAPTRSSDLSYDEANALDLWRFSERAASVSL